MKEKVEAKGEVNPATVEQMAQGKVKKEKEMPMPHEAANAPFNPKEWQIEWRDPNELTPYAKNARKNEQTVPYLMNSIKRFGFKMPLVVDKNGVVVCGHTRLKAALNLGFTKVPCVKADDLSDTEIKALRLADNKIQELSGWDFPSLQEQLDELKIDFDEDMGDFGFEKLFSDADVDDFFADDTDDKETKKKTVICTCPHCGQVFEQEVE